jgi:hypothetical protein
VPDEAFGARLLMEKTAAAVAAAKVRKTSELVVMMVVFLFVPLPA